MPAPSSPAQDATGAAGGAGAGAPAPAGGGSGRLTALIVACALFMQNLDGTVVATALPAMARAFGSDPLRMNVALTSYLLSLAVFIPVSGWMADRFGARDVFRAAIAVFTVGSVLCGLSTSLPQLVGARVVQGVGGAMMVPVGRLVLLRSVAKNELVAAMAWLTIPALIGPLVGPPLGGLIVTYADWRWIFDVNVPIGVLGIALVTRFVPAVKEPPPGRLDWAGLGWSGVALVLLMGAAETAGRGLVPWSITGGFALGGLACCLGYWLHARGHSHPLLDLGLMRYPTFAVSLTAGTMFRIGVGAIPFLLPLMLQLGFGLSPAQSGMITFASAIGALAMKTAAQRALRAFGFRSTLIWNGAAAALLLSAQALMRPDWPAAALYGLLIVAGFLRSLQFTAYNTIAYAEIPRERMSAATSLYSTVQQVSLTLGITVAAASLELARALGGHVAPTLGDFSVAFLVVGACSLLATPIALALPRDAGAELSGHVLRSRP